MPRLHALELLPDDDGAAAVRADWQRLRDAGLPSMLDHRGATNTPHVTVLATPAVTADDETLAVTLLGPLLPATVRAAGLAVLGGRQVSLVRVLDVGDPLVTAVLALRAGTAGHQHTGWLPHVTLARRLPRDDVQRAVDVLGHDDVVIRLSTLRRWDPDTGTVRLLTSEA